MSLMRPRCLGLLAQGAAALTLIGCATEPVSIDPGLTRFYVIRSVDFVSDSMGGTLGVDVDGVTSTGAGPSCVDQEPDFASVTEAGVEGVDNAFAEGISSLVDPDGDGPCTSSPDWACQRVIIGERFAAGEGLIVLEVSGIHEGLAVDPVRVAVHRASAAGLPTLVDGLLAPGQSFALALLTETVDASITEGRLRARFHEPLDLGLPLPLPALHDAQLSLQLSPTSLHGVLGGGLDPEEGAALAEAARPGYGPVARDFLSGVADLDPDPSDPAHCRAASLGLGIDAVTALAR